MTSPTPRVVRLRSGVAAVPRGDGFLQVGSDPARRVLLPDTNSIGQLLQQLQGGRVKHNPRTAPVLDALDSVGLVVDIAEQRLLLEARAHTRISLRCPQEWRPLAETLLHAGGLATARSSRGADVVLVLTLGEPPREEHDLALSADRPTLFVSLLDARVRVGPFVMPGATACLRCMDAWILEQDPGHRPAAPAPLPPHDLSPLLVHQALLTATADLCSWAEGRQPRAWSASLWYDERLGVEEQRWPRHPHCGCCWGDELTG